jgi:NAD(P)-dependent dehydrogenase (short-subunit alcohol dehydrogenase family)
MDTNVKGVYYLTVALLKQLEAAGRPGNPARVINIGSINGLRVPNLPNWAYGASKAAVHHLTAVLGKELGPRNISVNAIAPGPFETKMNQMEKMGTLDRVIRSCPLGRIGVPGDMAGVALFLASRAGSYLNGVVIPVDGGIIL